MTRSPEMTPVTTPKTKTPLAPDAALLVKLGSIVVHAEEMLSPNGHQFDRIAIESLLNDASVVAWMASMGAMGLLPVKR